MATKETARLFSGLADGKQLTVHPSSPADGKELTLHPSSPADGKQLTLRTATRAAPGILKPPWGALSLPGEEFRPG